jgi:hypothetical protein
MAVRVGRWLMEVWEVGRVRVITYAKSFGDQGGRRYARAAFC